MAQSSRSNWKAPVRATTFFVRPTLRKLCVNNNTKEKKSNSTQTLMNKGLVLSVYDHCPYCIRVELVLGWLGLNYERVVYGYGDMQLVEKFGKNHSRSDASWRSAIAPARRPARTDSLRRASWPPGSRTRSTTRWAA